MNRRQFITGLVAGTSVLSVSGLTWLNIRNQSTPLTIDGVLSQLDTLNFSTSINSGSWPLAKVLHHCAQSVELSMTGYPSHQSDWFKQTIGATAFAVFSAKQRMYHSLDAPIPGAPLVPEDGNLTQALQRLAQALHAFKRFDGQLKPHFAYGKLSKLDYERAHSMHFNNHMEQFRFPTPLA
ncbi:DUF1569 domain-containing protein [Alteromonas sediminis]|uniref:DUF1569 domain-containing protein n=1 Tax=Alteromonas sediminis TaxID=2259342 RepID=A0A3N5ZA89_9ALTE|nr:DUF1569 domain-containing protein [Alteromonas sediminis]RPJ66308.1 DUF1569 domain-containing protein [Alteromonas sediminis]